MQVQYIYIDRDFIPKFLLLFMIEENYLGISLTFFGTGILLGMSYLISDIKNANLGAIKVKPTLQCNKAKDGTVQLFQMLLPLSVFKALRRTVWRLERKTTPPRYTCVNKTASKLKNCRKLYKDCPKQIGNTLISFPLP